jgi:drug/metabolite transporter (DMT)-like permease
MICLCHCEKRSDEAISLQIENYIIYNIFMWFIFSLLSGLFYTGQGLITRKVLRAKKDAWAFSFYFSAIGALISLPFLLIQPKITHSIYMWLLMLIVGLLIVIQNFLNFKATNYLEATLQGVMLKFRLVWVFIFGIIILHESFSWQKTIGTSVVVLSGLLVISKFNKPKSIKGIILSLSGTVFYAIVIICYKFLFKDFNSQSLTFFIFFIPTVLNLLIMPNSVQRVIKLAKEDGIFVFIACTLGAFANLAMNQALSIGEVSKVLVIIEAFLIFTLVGEHFLLKERKHLLIKIITIIIVIIGAILIRLS